MYRLLIADDDETMLSMVQQILTDEGYDVIAVNTSDDVLETIVDDDIDLLLIDLALPGKLNGISLCERLRQIESTANKPIIFLTGHREVQYAVKALESGGDDYIRKPFALRELVARIRAHLRRAEVRETGVPQVHINPETYQVFVDSREVSLTRIEFDLLYFMVNSPTRWHSTDELLTGVWNYPEGVGDSALVRNHIRNLRRKLEENPDHPDIVQSRHGRGYAIRAQVNFDVAV